MRTGKLVMLSLFTSFALGLYGIESLIPPIVPIPGVRLGLANIVTLVVMIIYGRKEAFITLALRIALSSLLFGQMTSFWFSMAGGLLCFLFMSIALYFLKGSDVWAMSILGALGHNLGQIAVAIAITSQFAIAYYFLFLILSSIITGLFTGLCSSGCIKYLKKFKMFQN